MRDQHDSPLAREIAAISDNGDDRLSRMAAGLKGSEILKIAADIRQMMSEGKEICNLTVGDFSPSEFRIPAVLEHAIKEALTNGETNYPPTDGLGALKAAVQKFYREWLNLHYPTDSIVITSGSRPGIYTTYASLVDPGDTVVYPVPSWNNNHYCHISGAIERPVVCGEETDFLPTRAILEDAIEDARLIALNSPLNPTGTAFTETALEGICDLVLEENERRRRIGGRPLYVMYDQVYWMLTFGTTKHVHPVGIRPEMAAFTVYVDGISKAFAATGVRVGWVAGPHDIIPRMASLLAHIGAWAPRAEQVATAKLLNTPHEIRTFHAAMKDGVQDRLDILYDGINTLRHEGFPVSAIAPMGAIYLSARFALIGRRTPSGVVLRTNEDIRRYLLHEARLAIVPFQAFGSVENTGWFRLSVGAVSAQDIQRMFERLRQALAKVA